MSDTIRGNTPFVAVLEYVKQRGGRCEITGKDGIRFGLVVLKENETIEGVIKTISESDNIQKKEDDVR